MKVVENLEELVTDNTKEDFLDDDLARADWEGMLERAYDNGEIDDETLAILLDEILYGGTPG